MGSLFFFFKQKTAYEMRISDWSSDVCSSDLGAQRLAHIDAAAQELQHHLAGGGFSRAPPGQRALQPEQPVEPVAVGGIENGLRHHVLQYLLVLQQEDPVVEQQRQAEILEVDGVRSFLATIRQDPYVLGVVDSVLAVEAE